MSKKSVIYYKQSGVVPYIQTKKSLKFVMVTSKNGHWIFPKGLIDKNLSSWKSAEKEAWEEAGIIGRVDKKLIDKYEYEKWDGVCQVKMHLMQVARVKDKWDEMEFRQRKILSFDNALEIIHRKQLPILLTAATLLGLTKPKKKIDVA